MEKIELVAEKRKVSGKKNRALRLSGKTPAVVYGRGVASESLELETKAIERVFREAGGNKIVSLKVGGGRARNVLITDVQHEPVQDHLIHVDFYAVRMDEALKAEVPVHFTGEAPAVRQDEGMLVKNLEMIEVECLPADLPEAIEVSIDGLDDFEKTVTLADITLPEGVKLTEEDLTVVVAKVEAPRTEEEIAELDEAVESELPEGVAEEDPTVVSEENEGDKDRRDKK